MLGIHCERAVCHLGSLHPEFFLPKATTLVLPISAAICFCISQFLEYVAIS